eukprot:scaffold20146_cov19-Tisochrysis_lutea.AAC.1
MRMLHPRKSWQLARPAGLSLQLTYADSMQLAEVQEDTTDEAVASDTPGVTGAALLKSSEYFQARLPACQKHDGRNNPLPAFQVHDKCMKLAFQTTAFKEHEARDRRPCAAGKAKRMLWTCHHRCLGQFCDCFLASPASMQRAHARTHA